MAILKNRIAELIKSYRKTHKRPNGSQIAQHEIAVYAGIDPATLSRYKNEIVTRYDSVVLEKLCDFFNVDIGDILYLDRTNEDE